MLEPLSEERRCRQRRARRRKPERAGGSGGHLLRVSPARPPCLPAGSGFPRPLCSWGRTLGARGLLGSYK